jgi:hypothetical protein
VKIDEVSQGLSRQLSSAWAKKHWPVSQESLYLHVYADKERGGKL